MPRSLVVIPCLNAEATLSKALGSALKFFESGQVVLVDNGSTDGSLAVAKVFGVEVLSLSGGSISALRNYGAALRDSDLICFLDADCELVGNYREAVVSRFEDKSIAATGSRYIVPKNPHFIERAWFGEAPPKLGEVSYINSGNLLVRRDAFEAVGGFDESLETGEDYELCQRLKEHGKIFSDPKIGAIHHGNPKTWTGFYRKQVWHGKGGLGSLKHSKLDKPLIGAFLCYAMLLGFLFGLFLWAGLIFLSVFGLLVLLLASALYHSRGELSFERVLVLVPTYFLYYIARGRALIG